MMGPSHAMSGAALWLGGTALLHNYMPDNPITSDPAILVMGTVISAGAALAPDIDSYSSTVTRSFGIFGRLLYYISNAVAMTVHGITKTKYDSPRENGHRTFFHTMVAALLMGGLVALATFSTLPIEVFGNQMTLGKFSAIVTMAIFLHLAMGGLFASAFKKAKSAFGPYLMLAISVGVASVISLFLPDGEQSYAWLGIAVAFGWFVHLLGDLITKMGVPLLWPIKLKGRRWYDITLPDFMRITAGGTFEYVIIVPLLTIATLGFATYHTLIFMEII